VYLPVQGIDAPVQRADRREVRADLRRAIRVANGLAQGELGSSMSAHGPHGLEEGSCVTVVMLVEEGRVVGQVPP
jgi:hypothetical protein